MTDNQIKLLEELKTMVIHDKAAYPMLAFGYVIKKNNSTYDELSQREEYEVMKAFGEWGLS